MAGKDLNVVFTDSDTKRKISTLLKAGIDIFRELKFVVQETVDEEYSKYIETYEEEEE